MAGSIKAKLIIGVVAVTLAGAADAKKKKVELPPPPPPPVPVVVIPPRPLPPLNASKLLNPPAKGPDGVRHTVNYQITPAQTLWNLRSAYNVAALDCLRPEHAAILTNYKAFLKANAKTLALANRTVDAEYRARFGPKFIKPREAYMTQVYNFYALPPTVPQFCDAALAMSSEAATTTPKLLSDFAMTQLPKLDMVFDQFFGAYEQWKNDAALWDARYAPSTLAPPLPPAFATPGLGMTILPAQVPAATSTAVPAPMPSATMPAATMPAPSPTPAPTRPPATAATTGPNLPGT